MSERQEIAAGYWEAFDAEREALFEENASLFLVLNAGTPEQSELEVEGGWIPERQQKFGEVSSIRLIKIVEREALTPAVMLQADRLRLNSMLHQCNFDPPVEDPWWVLYATEFKEGGLR